MCHHGRFSHRAHHSAPWHAENAHKKCTRPLRPHTVSPCLAPCADSNLWRIGDKKHTKQVESGLSGATSCEIACFLPFYTANRISAKCEAICAQHNCTCLMIGCGPISRARGVDKPKIRFLITFSDDYQAAVPSTLIGNEKCAGMKQEIGLIFGVENHEHVAEGVWYGVGERRTRNEGLTRGERHARWHWNPRNHSFSLFFPCFVRICLSMILMLHV